MINVNDRFLGVIEDIEREFDELSELVLSVEIMSDHKLLFNKIEINWRYSKKD